jgi:hypothetical protein
MRAHSNGHNVIVITKKNIDEYVTFPPHILQKYKTGKIPVAHFTDLLRSLLLVQHGGIWLDATVFLSSDIPQFVDDSEFFVFQDSLLDKKYSICSSWFMAAKPDILILKKVLTVLFDYWKKKDFLIDYFLFHRCIFVLVKNDDIIQKLWNNMFYKNNSDPHFLQFHLFDKFASNVWEHIQSLSFAHKLTYKFSEKSLVEKPDTYYRHIVEKTVCL